MAGAATPAAATSLDEPVAAARYALLDTIVLMPLLIFFILNATEAAIVVLIVVVTLLRQTDRQRGKSAALGLILGNLIAGVAAGIAYNVILLGNTLPFFVTVCLAATLVFAGRIATAGNRAAVYVVALGTFVLLLGLSLSPLPGSTGEAFVSRILNVIFASAYASGGLSLAGTLAASNALCRTNDRRQGTRKLKMAKRNSRTVRAAYLAALIQGLGVTWPVLSGLLLFKASVGAIVGVIEGWGIWQGIYFAFITGLTIGYGDLAPRQPLTQLLAVVIGFSGVLLTGLVAALAVKAIHAVPRKRRTTLSEFAMKCASTSTCRGLDLN